MDRALPAPSSPLGAVRLGAGRQLAEAVAPWLLRGAARVLAALPLPVARAAARAAAGAAWLARSRAVRNTLENIERCFPELPPRRRRQLAWRSMVETACTVAETGIVWHGSPARTARLFRDIHGMEAVESAGGPVLVLIPHYGNWELLAFVFGQGPGLTCLYAPPKIGSLEPLLCRARTRWNCGVTPTSPAGIRRLYSVARDNGVVALLPDQTPPPEAGVQAPFFGHDVLTMTLAHRLIVRLRPRVVVAWVERVPGAFVARIEEVDGAIHSPDPLTSATAMNAAIERIVRGNPAQYQWEYKRFRRRGSRSAAAR